MSSNPHFCLSFSFLMRSITSLSSSANESFPVHFHLDRADITPSDEEGCSGRQSSEELTKIKFNFELTTATKKNSNLNFSKVSARSYKHFLVSRLPYRKDTWKLKLVCQVIANNLSLNRSCQPRSITTKVTFSRAFFKP